MITAKTDAKTDAPQKMSASSRKPFLVCRKITRKEKVSLRIDDLALGKKWLKKSIEITTGFSGREISKLMIALQGSLFGSRDGEVSLADVVNIIQRKAKEHEEKAEMMAQQH